MHETNRHHHPRGKNAGAGRVHVEPAAVQPCEHHVRHHQVQQHVGPQVLHGVRHPAEALVGHGHTGGQNGRDEEHEEPEQVPQQPQRAGAAGEPPDHRAPLGLHGQVTVVERPRRKQRHSHREQHSRDPGQHQRAVNKALLALLQLLVLPGGQASQQHAQVEVEEVGQSRQVAGPGIPDVALQEEHDVLPLACAVLHHELRQQQRAQQHDRHGEPLLPGILGVKPSVHPLVPGVGQQQGGGERQNEVRPVPEDVVESEN
mmetsp:Transcript_2561/g.5979  ORF Transcript_2561/g.5979 Transcript_2561/m.5979 type:complete len:259 (-) Transcript_2561:610-1386(-)